MLMKRFFVMLAFAPALVAAPFDPKDVAAKPAVLAHVDFDALIGSSIGKSILNDPDAQSKLATVAALFDFDLRKQLHGATVYTTEDHPKDGVLIVYADFDADRLIALAKAAKGSECLTNGSHVIYSWLDDKKKHEDDPKRVYGAISGHRVIFGQDESTLADALDVMEGKGDSFSAKDAFPPADEGESTIAEAAVLKFPFDVTDQNAAIFKMSKSVRLKVGEVPGSFHARVQFEAADSDTATQIAAIAQGLDAILKLQKSDTNLLELANSVAIKQNGSTVAVSVSLPTSDVLNAVKEKHKKEKNKDKDKDKDEDTNSPAEQK